MNNKCIDCNKLISKRAKRCLPCSKKGKLSPVLIVPKGTIIKEFKVR